MGTQWVAGVGRADITPVLPVALAGYGDRQQVADRVHDRLEVRVLTVADGAEGPPLALVVLDLLLLSPELAPFVRRAVAEALDVDDTQVLPSCVHLHGAPSTVAGGEQFGWPVATGYVERVAAAAADAARRAWRTARPVTATFGRSTLPPGVAVNRRGHAFEPSVAVLALRVADDGRDDGRVVVRPTPNLATLVNIGMHPTVSGPANVAVSTDWVGPCRRQVEADLGGTALVLQGCGGDVNPARTSWEDGDPATWAPVADEVGDAVALAARQAAAAARPVAGTVAVRARREVAITKDPSTVLGALTEGEPDTVELVEWALGDVTLLNVPGEGFHHLEQAVRASRGDRVLLAGLSPDWRGYLPVPFEDGYEESLSYGRRAVAAIGAALIRPAGPPLRRPLGAPDVAGSAAG